MGSEAMGSPMSLNVKSHGCPDYSPGRKLGLLGNIMRYDLPLNYRTQQANILKETDREVLNALANQLIQPENMTVVIVGDEATIREELEGLGMPIKNLDEDGFEIE